MPIIKSKGVTEAERILADICENTFLNLWSYPNPFKDDGKELCDLIVVFENHVILFFDRESRKFDGATKDILISWKRWKKEAIDKQIKTVRGAEKYICSGRKIYLDEKGEIPFPIPLGNDLCIHRVVVAHGAMEACLAFSEDNVSGSLGISYETSIREFEHPFTISLDRINPVHVFDTQNLKSVFETLDTLFDFTKYLAEKERAIQQYDSLIYCGEEDLVAHYLLNFNAERNGYQIGTDDKGVNGLVIGEGEWQDFSTSSVFLRREQANEISYLWDKLIQRTCENALADRLGGDLGLFHGKSAIHEMAKEPRFSRRALSSHMQTSIAKFPISNDPIVRNLSFMPSFFTDVAYVFLQLKVDEMRDYETEYRPMRQWMLEVACGSARNKFPHLNKVIGIAIEAPAYHTTISEDFILMECNEWPEDQAAYYEKENRSFNFFETKQLEILQRTVKDFPAP